MEQQQPSNEDIHAFMGKMMSYLTGGVVMSSMCLGDRLGIFEALGQHGPITLKDLAEKLSLNERLLREWLYHSVSVGVITMHEDKYSLSPVQKMAFTNEMHSPLYFLGGANLATVMGQETSINRSAACFRSGEGAPYETLDVSVHSAISRFLAPWKRHFLVPTLASLAGGKDALEAGAKVGDVGCGYGESLIAIARAYPKAECHGFENCKLAVAGAYKRLEEESEEVRKRIHYHTCGIDGSGIPDDGSFDIFITNDCLHDMAFPTKVATAVKRALKPSGFWLAEEPVCMDDPRENITKNPVAGVFYGASLFACLPSAMSGQGGSGEAHGAKASLRASPTRCSRRRDSARSPSIRARSTTIPSAFFMKSGLE